MKESLGKEILKENINGKINKKDFNNYYVKLITMYHGTKYGKSV